MNSENLHETERLWAFRGFRFHTGQPPLWMGILNVTPDSFSDGGQFQAVEDAVRRAVDLVEQGADLIDIGGESTRPDAAPVPVDEELRRVIPVITELARQVSVPISIDTTKATVARAALEAGASVVNDISGLRFDADMVAACRDHQCGIVAMHIQGTPQTMQQNPTYDNVVEDVLRHLQERLDSLMCGGISEQAIALDPGIGFGKTAVHNVELLSNVARFRELGRPVLIGHSRKRFLRRILNRPVDDRLQGTVGVSAALAVQYADVIRVHDVAANRDAALACLAALGRYRLPPGEEST